MGRYVPQLMHRLGRWGFWDREKGVVLRGWRFVAMDDSSCAVEAYFEYFGSE